MLPTLKKEAWDGGRAAASSAANSGGSSAKTAGSTWLMVSLPTATLHSTDAYYCQRATYILVAWGNQFVRLTWVGSVYMKALDAPSCNKRGETVLHILHSSIMSPGGKSAFHQILTWL